MTPDEEDADDSLRWGKSKGKGNTNKRLTNKEQ